MLIENIIRQDESILKDDEIVVFVDDLADSAVVIGARAWAVSYTHLDVYKRQGTLTKC